jgi:hypothetical protein
MDYHGSPFSTEPGGSFPVRHRSLALYSCQYMADGCREMLSPGHFIDLSDKWGVNQAGLYRFFSRAAITASRFSDTAAKSPGRACKVFSNSAKSVSFPSAMGGR